MDNSFAYRISTSHNRHFMCVVVSGEGEGVMVCGVRV